MWQRMPMHRPGGWCATAADENEPCHCKTAMVGALLEMHGVMGEASTKKDMHTLEPVNSAIVCWGQHTGPGADM